LWEEEHDMENHNLRHYYARRASEYERVYAKPERQTDLASLTMLLRQTLQGHDVLEIACGTGYWTALLAHTARSILATDATPETLAVAQTKDYPPGVVRFDVADAFALDAVDGTFTAGFAGFWWSHVPRERLAAFLNGFHHALAPGALAVFADNRYVEGSNYPIARHDDRGNTYQYRALESGQTFEVLKNFPGEAELRAAVAGRARDVEIILLTYYWCMAYWLAP
jgi:SAM-dependent methyltransferase